MSKSYSKHDLNAFLDIPGDRYLECAKTAPWGLGKWPEFGELQKAMRACIPVPGTKWKKDVHVLIEEGEEIRPHAHADEWTAIFYVDPGYPRVAIIIDPDGRIEPKAGQLFVLRPGVVHAVEKSKSERTRISFAMLVESET